MMLIEYKEKKNYRSRVLFLIVGVVIGFCISLVAPTNGTKIVSETLSAHGNGTLYGLYTAQNGTKEEIAAAAVAAQAWKKMAQEPEILRQIAKNVNSRPEPFHVAVVLEALSLMNSGTQQ